MALASSRTTSGSGTVAAVPAPSHYNDQGARERWPVLVYRLQSGRNWEVYSDLDQTPNGANAVVTAAGELTAAPRRGCIEVRKMRLRIQLFAQHTPWDPNKRPGVRGRRGKGGAGGPERERGATGAGDTSKATGDVDDDADRDGEDDPDAPGDDGWNNNSLLVRRRDTLLVTTRRGMGAVVFRFQSVRDCVDFCDRLTFLNREYLAPPESDAEEIASKKEGHSTASAEGHIHGMNKRERRRDEMIQNKRLRGSGAGAISTILLSRPQANSWNEETPPTAEEATRHHRHEELMSYVVRLANSAEFGGFVDELEHGLKAAAEDAAEVAAFGL